MQAGAVVEQGPVTEVLQNPATDYARNLIASAPKPPVRESAIGEARVVNHA